MKRLPALSVGSSLIVLPLTAFAVTHRDVRSGRIPTPRHLSAVSSTANEFVDTPCFAEGKKSAAASGTVYPVQNMPRLLLLRSGEALRLTVNEASGFRRGGTWMAEYGDITSGGVYKTPPYMPQEGLDTITYKSPVKPEFHTATISVRIEADPAHPESAVTPYVLAGFGGYAETVSHTAEDVANHRVAPPFVGKHPTLVLQKGEKPPALTVVSYIRPIYTTTVGGISGRYMPAHDGAGGYTNSLYVESEVGAPPLREAREIPMCFP